MCVNDKKVLGNMRQYFQSEYVSYDKNKVLSQTDNTMEKTHESHTLRVNITNVVYTLTHTYIYILKFNKIYIFQFIINNMYSLRPASYVSRITLHARFYKGRGGPKR